MAAESPAGGATKLAHLEQVSFPRLLFALLRNRFTGTLQLDQPVPSPGRRTIWIRGGMPVFTDWVSPSDVLGRLLVDRGAMSPAQLDAALHELAEEGGLLGDRLVRQGTITNSVLSEALLAQCMRKLAAIFACRNGAVSIVAEDHSVGEGDGLRPVNVLAVVREGVFTHYDEARAIAELGEVKQLRVATGAAFSRYRAHFQFRPEDDAVLERLSVGATLDELAHLPEQSRLRAARLFYILWACQMVAAAGKSSVAAQPATSAHASSPPPSSTGASFSGAPLPARTAASENSEEGKKPRTTQSAADPPGEFENELAAFEAKIEAQDHPFSLFGISTGAGRKEVRHAWTELSRKFHPDSLAAKGLDRLRVRVEKVFAALSEAHLVLADKEQREGLRAVLEMGGAPAGVATGQDATSLARAAIESEFIAKEADKLLKSGRFARALERYEEAARLNPTEPDLQAALAWCQYQVSSKVVDEAKNALARLDRILEESDRLARGHYFRGLVLLDIGNEELALAAFTKAYGIDARLVDAERQARAIKLRRTQAAHLATKPDRSLFGLRGIFTKK